MDSKARKDTFRNNNNLVLNNRNSWRYQYWLLQQTSTVLETWKEILDTYNLKQYAKKPTRQGVKTIDQIVSNLKTEQVLITDVLPCPTVIDQDASHCTKR